MFLAQKLAYFSPTTGLVQNIEVMSVLLLRFFIIKWFAFSTVIGELLSLFSCVRKYDES